VKRALALVVLTTSPVWAEDPKPDPAVGEPNLESQAYRKDYVFTLAIGAALTLGFGVNDSTGTGGAGTLRLAHVATPRSLILLEIVGNALFHSVNEGGMGGKSTLYTNQLTYFMLGAQAYANPALWFRISGGFGRYLGDNVLLESEPGQPMERGDLRLAGPALGVGAGVDVFRFKRFRISAELQGNGMVTREGLLTSGGFLIGFTFD